MRPTFFAAGVLLFAACTGDTASEPGRTEIAVTCADDQCGASSVEFLDIVSPAKCQSRNGYLFACESPSETFSFNTFPTAVPIRTVLRVEKTPSCGIRYPLAVSAETAAADSVYFPFLDQSEVVVRRDDGEPIAQLMVVDASPWTTRVSAKDSCRIGIRVLANGPDVDSTAEAEAILANLDAQLVDARDEVRSYEQLLAFNAGYGFMKALADSFHTELTNDLMQQLRHAARDASPVLELVDTACNGLNQQQLDSLFVLYDALFILGDPAEWQNPDGTTKSLEDFLGADAQAVMATIQGYMDAANPDLQTEYQQALQQAQAEVVALEAKRALAEQQLSDWLAP